MATQELDVLVDNLRAKGLSYSEIFKLMEKKTSDSVPLKIFKDRKLGALQAITIFLKEEKEMSFHQIAELLNRDDRTIWTTYHKGKEKLA